MRKVRLLPNASQPDSKYPFGSFKGSSTPLAMDGTPILAESANDWYGAFSAILKSVGMEANGAGEGVGSSQVVDAIKKLIQNSANSLNNSLQGLIDKLRSESVQGDQDTLASAKKYTDDYIKAHNEEAKAYHRGVRLNLHTVLNSELEALNNAIKSLSNKVIEHYVTFSALTEKLSLYARKDAPLHHVEKSLIESYIKGKIELNQSLFEFEKIYFYHEDRTRQTRTAQVQEGRVLKVSAGYHAYLCGYGTMYLWGHISTDGKTIKTGANNNCHITKIVGVNTYRK